LTPEISWGHTGLVSEMEKESTVEKIVDRLSPRFPEAPRSHIEGVVGEEYDSLDRARIRTYLPTLIEHDARTRLHREFSGDLLDG
jgi:hypothetical protein